MKTSWFKVGSAFSSILASALLVGCGAGDMHDVDASEDLVLDESADSEDVELGTAEQALGACATPDGANAVMAALAVAAGHELGRWRAGLDFVSTGQYIVLTSGTGSDGKPRGKSRCAGGVCPRIEALLALQYSTAKNVYVQGETSNTTVLVNPAAVQTRMLSKHGEQLNKDRDAKDGDLGQVPKAGHTLTGAGLASLGGCGSHYKFNVAFDATTTNPKPSPGQLKIALGFADWQNGWVDFRDLGNNVVAIDPTYGLNDEDTTSSGSCTAACTKITTTNVAGACCSCNSAQKTFKRSSFNVNTYLCQ
jgi:hypothetical protein